MSWEDDMYESIAKYLRTLGVDAQKVTSLEEDVTVYSYGGCETCGPEYDKDFELTISYVDIKGNNRTYRYNGGFTNLISQITQ